jgi:hypothetical protein
LIDRPTPLESSDGLWNWVRMFGDHWLNRVPPDRQDDFFEQVEKLACARLFQDGVWFADYRRLRVVAQKNDE